jgi:hypothetical protein
MPGSHTVRSDDVPSTKSIRAALGNAIDRRHTSEKPPSLLGGFVVIRGKKSSRSTPSYRPLRIQHFLKTALIVLACTLDVNRELEKPVPKQATCGTGSPARSGAESVRIGGEPA